MGWNVDWDKTAIGICVAGVTLLAVRRAVLYVRAKCPSNAMMNGKVVVITGANCGIGYTTALELARRQARVIMACRDMDKAEKAAKTIRGKTGNSDVVVKKLDLASLKSVREFCKEINEAEQRVDVLINNAGVMRCPYMVTEDGFENHMAVNHFGNFLLTNLLKDSLYRAPSSRVIFVSSSLHRFGKLDLEDLNSEAEYKKGKPYNNSKLMNLLFARELHKRYANDGKLCVYSLSPGMVRTSLGRHSIFFNKYFQILCFPIVVLLYPLWWTLVKTATEGCQTVVYCVVAPELEGVSDCYYTNCAKTLWSGPASDMEMAGKVWEVSARMCGLSTAGGEGDGATTTTTKLS